ncbi:PREDICTED: chromosome alignment-maintaining phosphoprotein 1 isoform X4 [Gavialis gangeticus]|uniref:chromosome alignment-maintaining phosphoprotein 1 isoform X4 n=1 Tax=Gavialis gangeticus TaxID=94835 RepID=UPI00092EEEF9|nr:PREDICTED: chromosome alignment-maintaining phosphoprotein 1 isoform X4 [Gavialis gangeticus]
MDVMEQSSKSLGVLNGKFIYRKLVDGSLDKRTVICSYCKAEFQYHRSTTSLKYHLRAKHAFTTVPLATDNPMTANESCELRQSTLTVFQNCYKPTDQTKYNNLTNAIAKWIAMDCRPLNIVNDRGLIEVIQIASSNQSCTLPSQGTIASRIRDLYHNEKTTKLELLKNAQAVALTGDHWTSLSNHSYLGVTAHLIDAAWRLQSFALTATYTEERHYAEACAEHFLDVTKEWNIQEKVTTISTGRASNMIAATSHLPFEHMTCIAHSLQRSITVALRAGGFENVLLKCRKILGHFKHSLANSAELKTQQLANGQKQEPLGQDISARWDSTLGMVQRLLRNKATITTTLALEKHSLSVLTGSDFGKLQKLETLLEPCRFVTELLGGELYVSCSVILPALCHVCRVMAVSDDDPAYVARFKNTFTSDLTKRKEDSNMRFLKIATVLDPRFKNLKCRPKSERDEVWNMLSEVLKDQHLNMEPTEPEPPQKKISLLLVASDSDDENEGVPVRTALDRYKAEPIIPMEACPLEWWSKHEGAYESLAYLAHKYLATPATAVPCERLFSLSGDIVNKKRAALSPENVNQLVCLNDWLKCSKEHRSLLLKMCSTVQAVTDHRKMDVLQILRKTSERLECDHCSFKGTDYENIQIHMGTIHPEYCDEMDAAGLGKLIFYQKSAKLFHCHKCFFTSKMYCNVYYHITAQHAVPEKWNEEQKDQVEAESESAKTTVTLEPQKSAVSSEPHKPDLSPGPPKSEPVVSPKLQKTSTSPEPPKPAPAASPEPPKPAPAASPEPPKPAPAASPEPPKPAPAVSPELKKPAPAASPEPKKPVPSLSPELKKPAPSVSPEPKKPAPTGSPEPPKPSPAGSPEPQKAAVTVSPEPRRHSPAVSPEPRRHSPAVSPEPRRHSPAVSPEPRRHSPAVSPEPRRHSPAVSPEPRRHSPAVSPEPRRHSPAVSPEPSRHSPAVSPEPRRHSPAVSPEPRRHSPAVSPEPRRHSPAVSPEPSRHSPAVSPEPRRHSPAVSPEPRRHSPAVSPEPRRHSPAVSPEPSRHSPAVSPEPRRHSPAVSPEPRRHSPAVSPEPRRHSPAVSPEPKKPAPAVSPEPRRYAPAVSPEPRRHVTQMRRPAPTASPEPRRPASSGSPEPWGPAPTVSPEPWRSTPVIPHELQKSSPSVSPWASKSALAPPIEPRRSGPEPRRPGPVVSPEPRRPGPVVSPEPRRLVPDPWKSTSFSESQKSLVSSEPWKPISSVYPEGWKPVLSPDTWKPSPPVSPELRKPSHTVSSEVWKPSFFSEIRKPGPSVSPEPWKHAESRKSTFFPETQKSAPAISPEVQKRAHFPEPRKRALFPESRKSVPAVSSEVQKRSFFAEPQTQMSAGSSEMQKHAVFAEAQKPAPVSPEIQKSAFFPEPQKLSAVSSEAQEHTCFPEPQKSAPVASPESQKHALFVECQKPAPTLSSETQKQALFVDSQKSAPAPAVSPETQKHSLSTEPHKPAPVVSSEVQKPPLSVEPLKPAPAVSSEVQKNTVFPDLHKPAPSVSSEPQSPNEPDESDFLSQNLEDQKPLDDLLPQEEQPVLSKEPPEDALYSCPKKKLKKENQENSDSELNSSECAKTEMEMDSVEVKEQESNSDQEQFDAESSEYSKESKTEPATPIQPQCVLQFTEEKEAFISEEEIAKYMKRGKGKYYCKICCCRAMKKGAVLHHLVNKHNVQSPYKCKICGKAFLLESLLKNHVAAHGQSLLKCPRCNFESSFPRGFKKHLTHCQSRHSEEANKKHLDSLEPVEEQI